MAISFNQMKSNLRNARRSAKVSVSDSELQRMVDRNCSNQAMCFVLGVDYKELKQMLRAMRMRQNALRTV